MAKDISKVCEYLYLSGVHRLTAEALQELKVTCVVDATNYPVEQVTYLFDGLDHFRVALEDCGTEMIHLYFESVSNKIREHRFTQGKTLVHCHLGMSRSPTLVIAYLMAAEQMSLRDAYLHLRTKRFVIRPNLGFWEQLIAYERVLRDGGDTSVKLVKTRHGETVPDVLLQLRSETEQSFVFKTLNEAQRIAKRGGSQEGLEKKNSNPLPGAKAAASPILDPVKRFRKRISFISGRNSTSNLSSSVDLGDHKEHENETEA